MAVLRIESDIMLFDKPADREAYARPGCLETIHGKDIGCCSCIYKVVRIAEKECGQYQYQQWHEHICDKCRIEAVEYKAHRSTYKQGYSKAYEHILRCMAAEIHSREHNKCDKYEGHDVHAAFFKVECNRAVKAGRTLGVAAWEWIACRRVHDRLNRLEIRINHPWSFNPEMNLKSLDNNSRHEIWKSDSVCKLLIDTPVYYGEQADEHQLFTKGCTYNKENVEHPVSDALEKIQEFHKYLRHICTVTLLRIVYLMIKQWGRYVNSYHG